MTPLIPPPHALLFDMDGTLVDSEPLWQQAEGALVAAHGHTLEPELRRRLVGISTPDAMRLVRSHFGLEADAATLEAELEARVLALLPQARATPGAAELLAWTAASGLSFALVSNSSRAIIDAEMAGQPWGELFAPEHRFSSEEVARGKPAPDLYLYAASRLGVAPPNCLAIEDTLAGVRSARSAGMRCWAVAATGAEPEAFQALTPHLSTNLNALLATLRVSVPG